MSQPKLMFQGGFTGSPTVFELVEQQQKTWKYFGYPIHRTTADGLARRIEASDLRGVEFLFVTVADLDKVGHAYGSHGPEIQAAWQRVDRAVERIYRHCAQSGEHVDLVIFGDHGMVDVTSHIDLRPVLKGMRAREWVDYAYFLDSTFARFWTFTEDAAQELAETLGAIPGASFVTAADRERYRCAYSHNRFGDMILWAEEGHIFLPNFYQSAKAVRGMHGYRREVTENHAGLIVSSANHGTGQRLETPVEMVDIFATLVDLLALPVPDAADGRSVLRR
jgi:arylsulfatase A-like enzyme